jgi:hypothetical protein
MPLELALEIPGKSAGGRRDETGRDAEVQQDKTSTVPRFWWNPELAEFVQGRCQCYLVYLIALVNMFGAPLSGLTMDGLVRQVTSWLQMVFHPMRARKRPDPNTTLRRQNAWERTRQEALRLLRRFRRTGGIEALRRYLSLKAAYKEEKKVDLELKKVERSARIKSLYRTHDWRELWKQVGAFSKSPSSPSAEIPPDQWRDYFGKLYNVVVDVGREREWAVDLEALPSIPELDKEITADEVSLTLKKMKWSKAPGMDGIPTDFYKKLYPLLATPLAILFNTIFTSGTYPPAWSLSVIQPLFKGKGSKKDPNNYRGIALLNSISKVFTKLLNNRLYRWVERNNKLSELQAGFRPGYSAMDQILILKTLIDSQLTRHGTLYVAFIDFAKAFDCIDRSAMWFKLALLGLSKQLLKLLQSMYSTDRFCVRSGNGTVSAEAASETGVIQGEQLSPLLFSLYISDIPEFVSSPEMHAPSLLGEKEIPCLFYADDDAAISLSPVGLQRHLHRMREYCRIWWMKVNVIKTKVMAECIDSFACSFRRSAPSCSGRGGPVLFFESHAEKTVSCEDVAEHMSEAEQCRDQRLRS